MPKRNQRNPSELGNPRDRAIMAADPLRGDAMTLPLSPAVSRRLLCALSLAAIVSPARAEPRAAQVWPRRPVRLVTHAADGARSDAMARTLAAGLARRWRQPVIVDHRPGGDVALAEAFVAARDDHALLLNPTDIWTTSQLAHDTLSFESVRELLPLAPVAQEFVALGVAPGAGFASLGEVLDAARRRPGKLTWASALHAPYLAFSTFLKAAGIELTFVSCGGPSGPFAGLTEGRVDLAFLPLPERSGEVQSGKIRLVAVASAERAPGAATVPTVGEAGYPSLAMFNGLGLFGPRDMPAARRTQIGEDVAATVRDPVVAERLLRMGYRPRPESPAAFEALLQRERARWSEVAQAAYSAVAAQ
jgi:tripartite-type tricarboxylate transporter receptor subunit TctC